MIDLDDTIVHSGNFYTDVVKELDPNLTDEQIGDNYYIEDALSKEKQGEFFDILMERNVYNYVKPLDNAFEVIEELTKTYEVFICSAYVIRKFPDKSGPHLAHKYDWIIENMPFIKPGNIVFCSTKEILECDVKIDDKVSNLKNAETKLLVTAYHNKNNIGEEEMKEKGITRVNNWLEIKKLLIGE